MEARPIVRNDPENNPGHKRNDCALHTTELRYIEAASKDDLRATLGEREEITRETNSCARSVGTCTAEVVEHEQIAMHGCLAEAWKVSYTLPFNQGARPCRSPLDSL